MSRIRAFIAVPLPEEIRDQLVGLQLQLAKSATGIKWVEQENLHVTMVFLGDISAEETATVCWAMQAAVGAMNSFEIAVRGVGCFPHAQRPRVLWAGIGTGTDQLRQMHDLVSMHLEPLSFRREERLFTPHITIGRVKEYPGPNFASLLETLTDFSAGETDLLEIHLYSSELRSTGSVYQVIGRATLAAK